MAAIERLQQDEIEQFRKDLLDWYAAHARDLPWRRTDDPYQVWVSEIMLQQTRVDQARPYFDRFIGRFPDATALAAATLDEVLLLWEGLGYYSRAGNLHRAARQIVEEFEGRFPTELSEIIRLAGVGPYTAAAILSIAYGAPIAAIDGNVTRILSRYLAMDDPVDRAQGRRAIKTSADALVDPLSPGSFNQALMDLGAGVCTPSNPLCSDCPVSEGCRAYAAGNAADLPVVGKKKPVPHYDIAVAVLSNDAREFLLTRRPDGALLGGLWEFPGARRRDGESLRDAVCRGVADRVGLTVEASDEVVAVKHAFSHFKITMHAFRCETIRPSVVAESTQPYRWIGHEDLDSVALHRAARKIADHIAASEHPDPAPHR